MSYRIGIDLGGTFVKFGAVDESGNILKKDKIPTPAGCDYGATVSAIAEVVKGMIADMGMPESVGIGCPGVIDGEHGMVVTGGNLGWENKPLAQDLGERLGRPVALCNDANAAAYGEYACGAGKEYRSIVLITLGTGVGSGIIFGGKLFTGELGAGAELHVSLVLLLERGCFLQHLLRRFHVVPEAGLRRLVLEHLDLLAQPLQAERVLEVLEGGLLFMQFSLQFFKLQHIRIYLSKTQESARALYLHRCTFRPRLHIFIYIIPDKPDFVNRKVRAASAVFCADFRNY